jgi:hypothetical protein
MQSSNDVGQQRFRAAMIKQHVVKQHEAEQLVAEQHEAKQLEAGDPDPD